VVAGVKNDHGVFKQSKKKFLLEEEGIMILQNTGDISVKATLSHFRRTAFSVTRL
jgi:hypothetical protein